MTCRLVTYCKDSGIQGYHGYKLTRILPEYSTQSVSKLVSLKLSCPPRWPRGSGLDFRSEDPGSIPGIPSPRVGPLMARGLKTSSDVPVPVSGYARHAKDS